MATKKTTRAARKAGASEEGPLYRVLTDSFIENKLVAAGGTVVYYGLPGSQLEPLNAEAKARKEQVREVRTNKKLDDEAKQAAFQALSDDWNGVDDVDVFAAGEAGLAQSSAETDKGK